MAELRGHGTQDVNISHADPIHVGAAMRDARERRGLSLDQISHATKISVPLLRSIENNRIDKLPEPVFVRGFLRAYAREVGLDPEETVRDYLCQFEPGPAAAESAAPATGEGSHETTRHPQHAATENEAGDRSVPVSWQVAAALLALVVVAYAADRWRAQGPGVAVDSASPVAAAQLPQPASPTAAARLETGTAGSRETTGGVAIDGDVLRVDIRPRALCWLSATVDGKRTVYRLMQPGEQQTIELHDEAVLRIGDAAAFAFSIGGAPGRVLGRPGEPVTLHVTKQNYRGLLDR